MSKTKLLGTAALAVVLGVGVATAQNTQRRDMQTQTPQQTQRSPSAQQAPEATGSAQEPSNSTSQTNTAPSNAQNMQNSGQTAPQQNTARQGGAQPSGTTTGQSTQQQPMNQPAQQPSNSQSAQQPGNTESAQQPSNAQSAQRPTNTQSVQQPANTQSAQQPANTQQQNAQNPATNSAPRNAQTQQAPQQQQAGAARVDASGRIALNEQQRTRVSSAIRSAHIRPERVNVSIRVGTAVPRSVRLETLPASLVEILPEYRGYRYFATEDRIVIVDPRSDEIVAFLPYEGGARAEAPARSQSSKLTQEDRELIRRHARTLSHTRTTTTVTVGQRVPDSVELQEFPETIYREAPAMRHYRYYAPESGGVTIVDPEQHTVIDTIE